MGKRIKWLLSILAIVCFSLGLFPFTTPITFGDSAKISTRVFRLSIKSHEDIVRVAFSILKDIDPDSYKWYNKTILLDWCEEIRSMQYLNYSKPFTSNIIDMIIEETKAVDYYKDLEFIDVDGPSRDNPHKDDGFWVDDDGPQYYFKDWYFEDKERTSYTGFNHYIDIRKGKGIYDDYDGYSYYRGSGHKNMYQLKSLPEGGCEFKDSAMMLGDSRFHFVGVWGLSDRYVHTSKHEWGKWSCSPSVERYSKAEDLLKRFPIASSERKKWQGIPYSVFCPVDNMADYWYKKFIETKDPLTLGPVLHAIGDASIPHHAAGCLGNWHREYEKLIESYMYKLFEDTTFLKKVEELVNKWCKNDPSPPPPHTFLSMEDGLNRTPAINWPIDQLVTWVALNAYKEYRDTYKNFDPQKIAYPKETDQEITDPYYMKPIVTPNPLCFPIFKLVRLNSASVEKLTKISLAMSVLVLKKAVEDIAEDMKKMVRKSIFSADDLLAKERIIVRNTVIVTGNLKAKEKNAVVSTENFGLRKVYCDESTEVFFFDRGKAQLKDGQVTVYLDPMFLETVTIDDNNPMRVRLTLTDDCKGIYVSQKTANSFTVKEIDGGKSDATFNWEVAAKRKGFEDRRLEEVNGK